MLKNKSAFQVCYGEQRTLEWIRFWFQERKENLIELDYYAERRLQRLGLLDDGKGSVQTFLQKSCFRGSIHIRGHVRRRHCLKRSFVLSLLALKQKVVLSPRL